MNVIRTEIDGLYLIEPTIYGDDRGYFYESYNSVEFADRIAPNVKFVQDNQSFSRHGVVRGLHFQNPPYAQAKLVRVIHGEVFDVAVDLRRSSDTYGKYFAVRLSGENHRQIFIPRGFAHGFAVLSDTALFQYKCDSLFHPEASGSLRWNDPDIGIDWPIPESEVILSEKDKVSAYMSDFLSPFD